MTSSSRERKGAAGHLGNHEGLTLIELMVVLFILALFAALVMPNLFPQVTKAEKEQAKQQMQILALALDTYRLDLGSYPESLAELVESSSEKWNGPYLRPERVPKDPWGNDYIYESVNDSDQFELYTSTKDGKELRYGADP